MGGLDGLKNLLEQCSDCDFWRNFKKAAPIIFCQAVEQDSQLKNARDMSFVEELLRTKSLMKMMKERLEQGSAEVDIVEYSLATKMLENKLELLKSLNFKAGDDEQKLTINIAGSSKAIEIDLEKLKGAITILDKQVEEKQGGSEEKKELFEPIDLENITEAEFLEKAAAQIMPVKKTEGKTLAKDSFIKIFKFTGDFAKIKSKEVKKVAQEKRMASFQKDNKRYLEDLKETVKEEEQVYEKASQELFEKICITPELFERSQQQFMMDPYVSMELFQMGINMEKPTCPAPESLNKEKTVELVKESNDYAFDLFKKEYFSEMQSDPMLMPVLISAIAHDYVYRKHNISEEQFKAALFTHKVYEDESVAMHMQQKQFELLSLGGGFNPMMGGGPGMGGPGMGGPPMGGPGMGGMGPGFGPIGF